MVRDLFSKSDARFFSLIRRAYVGYEREGNCFTLTLVVLAGAPRTWLDSLMVTLHHDEQPIAYECTPEWIDLDGSTITARLRSPRAIPPEFATDDEQFFPIRSVRLARGRVAREIENGTSRAAFLERDTGFVWPGPM